MSYVSRLRERERQVGRPVRVGLVGAGQMGRGLAAQLGRIAGMTLAAAVDVDAERARQACVASGAERIETDPARAAGAVADGVAVALDDVAQVADLGLDAVVDATGVPDVGARIAQRCLLSGIDFVTLNVETDVTVGLYLGALADASGAVYSVADGDEPVSAKELVDFATDLGFDVVCAGKGKNNPFDPTATPESVSASAETRHMNPKMLASFVDGSKTMIEMAALANATGFVPDIIGMHGPTAQVDELSGVLRPSADGGLLSAPGRVDYAFGPAPGVFVIVTADDPIVLGARARAQGMVAPGETPIVGTEVVTPLRHAMRFVDDKSRDCDVAEQLRKWARCKSFGRHVEQAEQPAPGRIDNFALRVGVEHRWQRARRDAAPIKLVDLILDQRD